MSYQPPISFTTYGSGYNNKKKDEDLLGLGYSSSANPAVNKKSSAQNRKGGSSNLFDPDDILLSLGGDS